MFARAGVGLRVQTLDEQGISELFDEIDNDSNELITEEELFEVIKSRGVRIDRFWFKAMIVGEQAYSQRFYFSSCDLNCVSVSPITHDLYAFKIPSKFLQISLKIKSLFTVFLL